MKLQFSGAAGGEVTGSSHLIHVGDKKVLLDCGLYQGKRLEAFEKNRDFLFEPEEITDLILSHAHIDHSGNIPTLVRRGFNGNIFTTFATRDLCQIMLADSAHIQELDTDYLLRKKKQGKIDPVTPIEALYTYEDVVQAIHHFIALDFHKEFHVNEHVKASFHVAGHILGSAITRLEITEGKKTFKIGFTGDLGRKGLPILRDPDQIEDIDYLIIESTYGNRTHEDITSARNHLEKVINKTVERDGKIIIPAFALERTQELIYHLHALRNENRIPKMDIFVDSPLAVNATTVFRMHPECYDKETRAEFKNHSDPFGFEDLQYITSMEDSKALNFRKEPCIIISAAGMCEAGRIRHHLRNNIEDPRNTILVVGYMAQNTLGRKIANREPKIKIFDQMLNLKSEVCIMNAFSAHADKNDLFNYVKGCGNLKKVFLVHGEEDQQKPFAERIRKELGLSVQIPERGEEIELH